jgi:hypothetical protein
VLVVLALKDTVKVVREIIDSVAQEYQVKIISPPDDLSGDWLFSSLEEKPDESNVT